MPTLDVQQNFTSVVPDNITKPVDFFNLYVDDLLIQHTVEQTNLYLRQCKDTNPQSQ